MTQHVILARHGESEYSARGLLNGEVAEKVGLTARGREEARRLGEALRGEPLDLCITSEFLRVRETADIALAGREVPRVVDPRLNDPRYGPYEGGELGAYRAWASEVTSSAVPEPGGESRLAVVTRYAAAFRALLGRPEDAILVVFHSLPLSYALAAREGTAPVARMPLADHATPYAFSAEEVATVVDVLERWTASPTW